MTQLINDIQDFIAYLKGIITNILAAIDLRVPSYTIAEARAYTGFTIKTIYITDNLKSGIFDYDSTDTTSSDDGSIVLVNGTKRYKRRITGYVYPEWWGAVGNGTTNDGVALQSAITFGATNKYTVKLTKTYKTTQQLSYITDSQFAPGLKILGSDVYSTRIIASGFAGATLYLNGNDSGTNGYHMNDVYISNFTITQDSTTDVAHGIEFSSLQNSTIANMRIISMKGDGVRVIATTAGDTGGSEYMTLFDIYTQFCSGWGLKIDGSADHAVPLTVSTIKQFVVNTCGEGVYLKGTQSIRFEDCVSTNANTYNLKFGYTANCTPCHLTTIDGFELGNNFNGNGIPSAAIMSLDYVQGLQANKVRLITNSTEVATAGIEFTNTSGGVVTNVTFDKLWVVMANRLAPMSGYKVFNFVSGCNVSAINVINPFYSELAVTDLGVGVSTFDPTKITNNASKFDLFVDEYSKLAIPYEREQFSLYSTDGSPVTSLTPKFNYGSYFINYNNSSPTNLSISYPIPDSKYTNDVAQANQELNIFIRNIAGLGTITWPLYLQVKDGTPPKIGEMKLFKFVYNKEVGEWIQSSAYVQSSMSIAGLRAYSGDILTSVNISEGEKSGIFDYVAGDTTSADDGAIIIVNGSRRYKRRIESYVYPEWFGAVGDGNDLTGSGTNDSVAFQAAFDYVKTTGHTIKLKNKVYRLSSPVSYVKDVGFYEPGLQLEGSGMYRTIIMPDGFDGECIRLTGNVTQERNHAHGFHLSDFSIKRNPNGFDFETGGIRCISLYHSTFSRISIDEIFGDGITFLSDQTNDWSTNEFIGLTDIYIKYCTYGYGISARTPVISSVPLAQGVFERVIVIGCKVNAYFERCQQLDLRNCSFAAAVEDNVVFNAGTSGPITISRTEFGNVTYAIPLLKLNRVINFRLVNCRFINNSSATGEIASCAISAGYGTDPIIRNLEIINPWIVQSNTSLSTYKFIDFADIGDSDNVVTIENPHIQDFQAGIMFNDLSKIGVYKTRNTIIRKGQANEVSTSNNPTSFTPDVANKINILNYTTATNTTINTPIGSPQVDDTITFVIRNNGASGEGVATLTFDSIYNIYDNTVSLTAYSSRIFTFKYSAVTNTWYQIDISIKQQYYSTNLTNATSLTPIIGGRYRLIYDTSTTLTLTSPSSPVEGDQFTLAFWNTNASNLSVTVTLSLSGIQPSNDNVFVLPTPQYAGFIVVYEYLGGYWFAKTYEAPKNKVFTISSNVNSTSTTRADLTNWTFPVVVGREYKIEIIAAFQTDTLTTGGSMGVLLKNSGAGTIIGTMEADVNNGNVATGLKTAIVAISSSNTLAGSFMTTTAVNPINTPHGWTALLYFTCTTSGDFQVTWGSEISATEARLLAGSKMIVTEI